MLWSLCLFRKINALGKLEAVSSYKVFQDNWIQECKIQAVPLNFLCPKFVSCVSCYL